MPKIREVKLSSIPTTATTKYDDYTKEELITQCLVQEKDKCDMEEAYEEILDIERIQQQEEVQELKNTIVLLKYELLEALRKLN